MPNRSLGLTLRLSGGGLTGMDSEETKPLPVAKVLTTVGSAVLLILTAYSIFWVVVSERAGAAIEDWASAQRSAGYTISWDRLTMSGYPFSLRVEIDKPQMVHKPGVTSDGWYWDTQQVMLRARPWNWQKFYLQASGDHRVSFIDARGGKPKDFNVISETLDISVNYDRGILNNLDISVTDLHVSVNGINMASIGAFQGEIEWDSTRMADDRTRTGGVKILFKSLNVPLVPPILAREVGTEIAQIALSADVYGPVPVTGRPADLAMWRDSGGVVEVRRAQTSYGPLHVEAEGTIALDATLQPVASLVAKVEGYADVVNILLRLGKISEGEALAATLVLGALAEHNTATGTSRLVLPVSIQNQTVQAGPLSLGKIPAVRW